MLNPIIEWSDAEVWEFIKAQNIPYCGLYDEGWKRLGCIGCPMATTRGREREFVRWPKYKDSYIRAFGRMLKEREKRNKLENWKMGTRPIDVFNWWMEYDILPGQLTFEDLEEMEEDNV